MRRVLSIFPLLPCVVFFQFADLITAPALNTTAGGRAPDKEVKTSAGKQRRRTFFPDYYFDYYYDVWETHVMYDAFGELL